MALAIQEDDVTAIILEGIDGWILIDAMDDGKSTFEFDALDYIRSGCDGMKMSDIMQDPDDCTGFVFFSEGVKYMGSRKRIIALSTSKFPHSLKLRYSDV